MTRTATPIIVCTLLASALLASTSAIAEWPPRDAFYRCDEYRPGRDWRRWANRNCSHWRRHHHARRAVTRADTVCHAAVAATGEQAQSEAAAWDAAIVAWRGRTRFLHGERYSDDRVARDMQKTCAPSSVPDAYRDAKLPALYRCEISAKPCRPLPRKLEKDED